MVLLVLSASNKCFPYTQKQIPLDLAENPQKSVNPTTLMIILRYVGEYTTAVPWYIHLRNMSNHPFSSR